MFIAKGVWSSIWTTCGTETPPTRGKITFIGPENGKIKGELLDQTGIKFLLLGAITDSNCFSGEWYNCLDNRDHGTFMFSHAKDDLRILNGKWLGILKGEIVVGEWTLAYAEQPSVATPARL